MPAIIFVLLNVTDAYLTKMSLAAGAVEINPLMAGIGSNLLFKGLIAIALVLALYYFGKERILWLLNFALFGIVMWNSATCLIVKLLPLQSFIGTHAGF
jgi:hypothetical protein